MSGIVSIQTKESLVSLIQANQRGIRAYGVTRIGLFGSFTRGQQKPSSDVDLLVEFEPARKTFDNFVGLATFLENLLNRYVELVTPESLSRHIGPYILKEVEYVPLDG